MEVVKIERSAQKPRKLIVRFDKLDLENLLDLLPEEEVLHWDIKQALALLERGYV